MLTRSLSHQEGAARAPLGEGRGTSGSEKAAKETLPVRRFDCQRRPSSSAGPDNREEYKHVMKITPDHREQSCGGESRKHRLIVCHCWFQLVKCEDFLLFFFINDSR